MSTTSPRARQGIKLLRSHACGGREGTCSHADLACSHIEDKAMHVHLLTSLPCTLHHGCRAHVVHLHSRRESIMIDFLDHVQLPLRTVLSDVLFTTPDDELPSAVLLRDATVKYFSPR